MDTEVNRVLEEYEKLFHETPRIPMMASYSVILSDMKEAIIRKKPLTLEESMEAYEGIPNDQGNADISKIMR